MNSNIHFAKIPFLKHSSSRHDVMPCDSPLQGAPPYSSGFLFLTISFSFVSHAHSPISHSPHVQSTTKSNESRFTTCMWVFHVYQKSAELFNVLRCYLDILQSGKILQDLLFLDNAEVHLHDDCHPFF